MTDALEQDAEKLADEAAPTIEEVASELLGRLGQSASVHAIQTVGQWVLEHIDALKAHAAASAEKAPPAPPEGFTEQTAPGDSSVPADPPA